VGEEGGSGGRLEESRHSTRAITNDDDSSTQSVCQYIYTGCRWSVISPPVIYLVYTRPDPSAFFPDLIPTLGYVLPEIRSIDFFFLPLVPTFLWLNAIREWQTPVKQATLVGQVSVTPKRSITEYRVGVQKKIRERLISRFVFIGAGYCQPFVSTKPT
jgi:hypothetical protein